MQENKTEMEQEEDKERMKASLREKIMEALLLINEANAMSDALGKTIHFELKLLSSFPRSLNSSAIHQLKRTKVGIKLTNQLSKETTVWSYKTFKSRIYEMRDIYQNFVESAVIETSDEDPFDVEYKEELIGVAHIYLKKLLYLFDINRDLPILDVNGKPKGSLKVELIPFFPSNENITSTAATEETDLKSLIGKKLEICIKIIGAKELPVNIFTNIYCKFAFWTFERTKTEICDSSLSFNYEENFVIEEVTEEFLNYLEANAIAFEIYGDMKDNSDYLLQNSGSQEFLAKVNILELNEDRKDFFPVPIKNTSADAKRDKPTSLLDVSPSTVFLVHLGTEKHIILSLFKASVEKCLSASICKVYLSRSKKGGGVIQHNVSSSNLHLLPNSRPRSLSISTTPLSSPMKEQISSPLQPPSTPGEKKETPLDILSIENQNTVTISWLPSELTSILFTEKTLKGYVISMILELNLVLSNVEKSVKLEVPIYLRFLEPEVDFREHTLLLDSFRDVIKQKKYEDLYGSLFSFKISKSRELEDTSNVAALIDEHQEQVSNLINVIRMEKLKQDLELHEQLSPIKKQNENDTKKEIEEQLETLKSTLEAKRRNRATSLIRANVKEIRVTNIPQEVEMSGYLLKKSNLKNKWKKYWFVVSRPFLYYYTSQNLENEKSIDISNSLVSPLPDIEHAFGIATSKQVICLKAENLIEMTNWIKSLDPSKQELALREKLDKLEQDLEEKKKDNKLLHSRIQRMDEYSKAQQKELHQYAIILTEKLNSLRQQFESEYHERRRKDIEIMNLVESNRKMKNELTTTERNVYEKSKQLEQRELELRDILNKIEDLPLDVNDKESLYNTVQLQLQHSTSTDEEKIIASQKQQLKEEEETKVEEQESIEKEQLKEEISQVKVQLETKTKESEAQAQLVHLLFDELKKAHLSLEQNNIKPPDPLPTIELPPITASTSTTTSTLPVLTSSPSTQEYLFKIDRLETQLKKNQADLVEKDYLVDSLNEKIKISEEEKQRQELQFQVLNDKIKSQKEEIQTKDTILQEKYPIKITEEKWSIFGGSKSDFLEKQLIQSKKASLAHQTHSAFLGMEISRLEKEMQLQLKLREQTIDRLKKEISLYRRRLLNLSRERSENVNLDEAEVASGPASPDEKRQYEALKKRFFLTHALNVKLNLSFVQGKIFILL